MQITLTVIAIHGEADRETVNKLQNHRNKVEIDRHVSHNLQLSPDLMKPADELPDVLVILRDEAHDFRIEWPVKTWEEIAEWKRLIGYDDAKRHWVQGRKVKVKLGA